MRSNSPSSRKQRQVVYGEDAYGDELLEQYYIEADEDVQVPVSQEDGVVVVGVDEAEIKKDKAKPVEERKWRWESAYVHVTKSMMNDVAEKELHLLSEDEQRTMSTFLDAPYNEQFVLSRLVLRRPGWHAVSSMDKWKDEIGEQAMCDALQRLCVPFGPDDEPSQQPKKEPPATPPRKDASAGPEIIDLTFDSDDESDVKRESELEMKMEVDQPEQKPQLPLPPPPPPPPVVEDDDREFDPANLRLGYFCRDDSSMKLLEALERLQNPSLKKICNMFKVKPSGGKFTNGSMIDALLKHASSQTVLDPSSFFGKAAKKDKDRKSPVQNSRLLQVARQELGACIILNPDFTALIHRLHIICYRSTEQPTRLLLPSLLTRFKKRHYPPCAFARDADIWRSREEYLAYEHALELGARLEEILNPPKEGWTEDVRRASTSARRSAAPGPRRGTVEEEDEDEADRSGKKEAEATKASCVAKKVRALFEKEGVWERWKGMVEEAGKDSEGKGKRRAGVERFEAGHIYTRVVSKTAQALHTLREFQYEIKLLDALLAQRRWWRGKRADWYDRRAMVKQVYMWKEPGAEEKGGKEAVLREALGGLVEALEDGDVRIVHRPGIIRRIRRIEKALKVAESDALDFGGEGELKEPEKVYVEATRLLSREGGSGSGGSGNVTAPMEDGVHMVCVPGRGGGDEDNKENLNAEVQKVIPDYYDPLNPPSSPLLASQVDGQGDVGRGEKKRKAPKWVGKSVWRGRNAEELTVEGRALQYYEEMGFRGFHSETSILTTLFSLLMWDIIFSPVPGAFETPFQVAPLDIMDESFFRVRKDAIEARLKEIKEDGGGKAREIIERVDGMYREKKTWCVGVRWDMCGVKELGEIAECLGGDALALICQLFCEDYGGRCGGVPDLIVWNYKEKLCKLVEVKGPGDKLSETQRMWIDTLVVRASTVAEVCHVLDMSEESKKKTPRAKRQKKAVESEDEEDVPLAQAVANAGKVEGEETVEEKPKKKRKKKVKMDAAEGEEGEEQPKKKKRKKEKRKVTSAAVVPESDDDDVPLAEKVIVKEEEAEGPRKKKKEKKEKKRKKRHAIAAGEEGSREAPMEIDDEDLAGEGQVKKEKKRKKDKKKRERERDESMVVDSEDDDDDVPLAKKLKSGDVESLARRSETVGTDGTGGIPNDLAVKDGSGPPRTEPKNKETHWPKENRAYVEIVSPFRTVKAEA